MILFPNSTFQSRASAGLSTAAASLKLSTTSFNRLLLRSNCSGNQGTSAWAATLSILENSLVFKAGLKAEFVSAKQIFVIKVAAMVWLFSQPLRLAL